MMKTLLLLLFLLSSVAAWSSPPLRQDKKILAEQIAYEIRAEFWHAWSAYKQYAWGHDGLKPLSLRAYDEYGVPFYLTAVDALDTMIMLGFDEEAAKTHEFLARNLSFDRDLFVSTSEFTTHYLGGLLSGFQLTGDEKFLRLAEDLGDRLLPAFISPTCMPYAYVNLKTGEVKGEECTPAQTGALLLEFGTLSALTGNGKYYNSAKIALLALYGARSKIGLLGDAINIMTGKWTKTAAHIGSGIGPYYEYITKCAAFFPDEDCGLMWRSSLEAINKYLVDSTKSGVWCGYADMNSGKRTGTRSSASDAYFPVVLSLSLDLPRAARFQDAYFDAWVRYGCLPDEFDYRTNEATVPTYSLDPRFMESAYYLYQGTHDGVYLSMGKEFLDSLRTCCRTETAYAELKNVYTKEKSDRMSSSFLCGTLKFLYLLYAPPEPAEINKVMFNDVGHPLRRVW